MFKPDNDSMKTNRLPAAALSAPRAPGLCAPLTQLENTMRCYYTTRIITPTSNHYEYNTDGTPNMTAPLYQAGEVVSAKNASFIKSEHGKDAIAHFDHTGVFSPEYRTRVYSVKSPAIIGETITYFVK